MSPSALRFRLPPWGCSSAGRASRWQREGQGFDPPQLHLNFRATARFCLIAGLACVALPGGAAAHIQVSPTRVAPDDAALFTVLVPGETDSGTTKVALQIPKGARPFSYAATPDWSRTLETGPDGATRVVRWSGRSAKDGFVRFSFLASTPATEGEISWKAIQTYSDGKKVAWIGAPSSENPAAVTLVTKAAAPQNAGGESSSPSSEQESAKADAGSSLTLGLSIAALLIALAAFFLSLRRKRSA